jgi:hypothetical protein
MREDCEIALLQPVSWLYFGPAPPEIFSLWPSIGNPGSPLAVSCRYRRTATLKLFDFIYERRVHFEK